MIREQKLETLCFRRPSRRWRCESCREKRASNEKPVGRAAVFFCLSSTDNEWHNSDPQMFTIRRNSKSCQAFVRRLMLAGGNGAPRTAGVPAGVAF